MPGCCREGISWARRLAAAEALASITKEEVHPGQAVQARSYGTLLAVEAVVVACTVSITWQKTPAPTVTARSLDQDACRQQQSCAHSSW